MAPIAQLLSDRFTTFCFDTPGYGLSDPLARPAAHLDAYVDAIIAGWDALGILRCALIGAATGAQIAIEIAKRHPDRVELLVADSACHFEHAERERILAGYFPDLTPHSSGSHLALAWQMARDLFLAFPWFDSAPAARLRRDIPSPEIITGVVLDYLRAGPDYARAYRLAFGNERAAQLQALRVPTLIPLWESSILKRYTETLLAQPLPSCVETLRIPAGAAARVEAIAQAVHRRYGGGRRDAPSALSPTTRHYLDAPWGQVHWRGDLRGSGAPVLVLHDCVGSSEQLQALIDPLSGTCPVIALDLPGNGESVGATPDVSIEAWAEAVETVMDTLGIDEVICWGRYAGAQIGLALAQRAHLRIAHLTHLGALVLNDTLRQQLLTSYAPALTAQPDGSHLFQAWHRVRDQAFFWPWFERTAQAALAHSPAPELSALSTSVLLMLGMGERYASACRCAFEYPTKSQLSALSAQQQTFAARPGEALHLETFQAGSAIGAATLELPAAMAQWPTLLRLT